MSHASRSSDLVVVGGGVIGLSIAWRAAAAGFSVTLLERGRVGREASWAGAGVLPPRSWYVDHPSLDRLARRAERRQADWSDRLREATGVDDEFSNGGARYDLSGDTDDNRRGAATLERWASLGVVVEPLGDQRYAVPAEAQVRNPRRLRALAVAARSAGVRVLEGVEALGLVRDVDRVTGVQTPGERIDAGAVCLAAGCWTPGLANRAESSAPGKPIRGQMLLLRPAEAPDCVLHAPPWYAVPRREGLVLVGATVEDVGFEASTTDAAKTALRDAATRLDRRLATAEIEGFWAGLRPAGVDPLPQIGWAPGVEGLLIASAHHRSGLQFSPPTAELVVSLLRGERLPEDFECFSPQRFAHATATA
ncbi:MAG: FAD-dependent oxidoreductase [Planctomycetota bacterium]